MSSIEKAVKKAAARQSDLPSGPVSPRDAATVSRRTTVGIDDDLAASQSAITHRSANLESPGRVDMVFGLVADPFGRNDRLDDLFHHAFAQIFHADVGMVLRR